MILASLAIALGTLLGVGAPPQAAQKEPLRVSGIVMQTQLVEGAPPKYPKDALKKKVQGLVKLDVIIGRNGRVKSVKVTDGPKELVKAAEKAVKHWRYKPTLYKGKPVEVETAVSVRFKLLPPAKKKTAKSKPQN